MLGLYVAAFLAVTSALPSAPVQPCLGPKYPFCDKNSVGIKSVHGNPQFANYEPALGRLYSASGASDVLEEYNPAADQLVSLPLTRALGANVDLVVNGIATSPYHKQVWISLASSPEMRLHGHSEELVASFASPLTEHAKPIFIASLPTDLADVPEYAEVKSHVQQLAVDSLGNAYHTLAVQHDWEPNGLFIVKIDAKGHVSTLLNDEWVSEQFIGHVILEDKLIGFGLNNGDAFFFSTSTTVAGTQPVVTKALNFAAAADKNMKKSKLQSITVMPSSDGTFIAVVAESRVLLFEHSRATNEFAYLGHSTLQDSSDAQYKLTSPLVEMCPGELHVGYWSRKSKASHTIETFVKLNTYRAPVIKTPCLA